MVVLLADIEFKNRHQGFVNKDNQGIHFTETTKGWVVNKNAVSLFPFLKDLPEIEITDSDIIKPDIKFK